MHVLYECHPTAKETLRKHRDEARDICCTHIHRMVRVHTIDGHVIEGTIVHIEHTHVYLAVQPVMHETRPVPFVPPYGPYPYAYPSPAASIMPLVLYELLTIALLP